MTEVRWPRDYALPAAEELRDALAPSCDLIEIAGSLRRKSPTVGDVELLVVPKIHELFVMASPFDQALAGLIEARRLSLRPNVRGKTSYGPKNKFLVDNAHRDLPIDIFTADLANWGMYLMVRTGSEKFIVNLMSEFKRRNMHGHAYPKPGQGGITSSSGEEIFCPTEQAIFDNLGWDYIEPENRI